MINSTSTYNNISHSITSSSIGSGGADVPLWIILPVIILFIVLIAKDLK